MISPLPTQYNHLRKRRRMPRALAITLAALGMLSMTLFRVFSFINRRRLGAVVLLRGFLVMALAIVLAAGLSPAVVAPLPQTQARAAPVAPADPAAAAPAVLEAQAVRIRWDRRRHGQFGPGTCVGPGSTCNQPGAGHLGTVTITAQ